MAWVRLDDQFPDHPKVAGLSNDALCLHITALCWTAKQQTDGHLPCVLLKRLAWRCHTPAIAVAELVAAGVWDDNGENGWTIHDYLDYNPSKTELETLAETRSAAGKAGAAARWQDHSKTHGKRYGKSDGKNMPHTPSPSPLRDDGIARPPAGTPVTDFPEGDPEWGAAISKLEGARIGGVGGSVLLELNALWPDFANGKRDWLDDAILVARANKAKSPTYALRVLAGALRDNERPGSVPERSATRKSNGVSKAEMDAIFGVDIHGNPV